MEKSIAIYVASHKKYEIPKQENYIPIQVGAMLNEHRFGYQTDCEGDNISVKNPNYCELTALYWIWKNSKAENVGLVHYRRYFCLNSKNVKASIIPTSKFLQDLEQVDIILPSPFVWKKYTCFEYYCREAGREKDLQLVRKILMSDYKDYVQSFDEVMEGNGASYCNMFVCKKELLNQYCIWLFDVLEKVESQIDMTGYNSTEARVFGYLSELLLNVWCKKQKLMIKYYPIANIEKKRGIAESLKQECREVRKRTRELLQKTKRVKKEGID